MKSASMGSPVLVEFVSLRFFMTTKLLLLSNLVLLAAIAALVGLRPKAGVSSGIVAGPVEHRSETPLSNQAAVPVMSAPSTENVSPKAQARSYEPQTTVRSAGEIPAFGNNGLQRSSSNESVSTLFSPTLSTTGGDASQGAYSSPSSSEYRGGGDTASPASLGGLSQGVAQSAAPGEGGFYPVDPAGPGNAMTVNGQLVSVEGSQVDEEGNVALDVSFQDAPDARNNAGLAGRAFSDEEDAFRAKWGWAAYANAQRASQEEPQ